MGDKDQIIIVKEDGYELVLGMVETCLVPNIMAKVVHRIPMQLVGRLLCFFL